MVNRFTRIDPREPSYLSRYCGNVLYGFERSDDHVGKVPQNVGVVAFALVSRPSFLTLITVKMPTKSGVFTEIRSGNGIFLKRMAGDFAADFTQGLEETAQLTAITPASHIAENFKNVDN